MTVRFMTGPHEMRAVAGRFDAHAQTVEDEARKIATVCGCSVRIPKGQQTIQQCRTLCSATRTVPSSGRPSAMYGPPAVT